MDILLALKASDKQVDKQRLEKKVNDEGDFDDEEEYQWRWRVISMMMKRKTDDHNKEGVKEAGNQVKWMGEEEEDEEEWKLDLPINPCQ